MNPTADWEKPAQLLVDRLGGKCVSAREAFLELGNMIAERYGKPYWIEKTPNHIHCLPFIRKLYPSAPIIHIIRDGRDVAHSLIQVKHFGSDRYIDNLWQWRNAVHNAREQLATDDNGLSIRYEDLVSQPHQIIRSVCDFLGIRYSANMLEPDGSEQSLIEVRYPHMQQSAKKISQSKVAAWRRNVPPELQQSALMIAGQELQDWGYPTDDFSSSSRPTLRVSEALIHSHHHGVLYDQLIEKIATTTPTRLQDTGTLYDPMPKKLPDFWVCTESPVAQFKGKSRLRVIAGVAKLLYHLARIRLSNTKLLWVFHFSPTLSKHWPLRTQLERVLTKVADATLCVCSEESQINEVRELLGKIPTSLFFSSEDDAVGNAVDTILTHHNQNQPTKQVSASANLEGN